MKRTLLQIVRTNFPGNLLKAISWLAWTVGSVLISLVISLAVDFSKKHTFDIRQGFTHGELFALSASLVIGSGRLILKDDDLEDFSGRQYFGLVAFLAVFTSEILFFVWKLDDTSPHPYLGSASLWAASLAFLFVFSIVLIDASRIPRPNISGHPDQEVNRLLKQVENKL